MTPDSIHYEEFPTSNRNTVSDHNTNQTPLKRFWHHCGVEIVLDRNGLKRHRSDYVFILTVHPPDTRQCARLEGDVQVNECKSSSQYYENVISEPSSSKFVAEVERHCRCDVLKARHQEEYFRLVIVSDHQNI
jgi:hypothetical protein